MNINITRNKETEDILSFFTSTFAHNSGSTNLEAIKFIEALQQRLETQMRKRISTKSIYYWFHLYRRIAPIASFEGESKQTVLLYRNILENAFQKYGKNNTNDELIFSKGRVPVNVQNIANGLYLEALKHYKIDKKFDNKFFGVFLGNFGEKELLEIYSLERLAYEFWHTTVCLRRIYKGGILHIERKRYWVDNDVDTEFLMSSYDSRGGDFEDLSCSDGISMFTTKISNDVMLAPNYNVEQLSLKEFPEHLAFYVNIPVEFVENFKPNFLWFPINFDYYYKNHEFYIKAFYKKFGYEMESFVYTLYLLLFREFVFCRENQTGLDNLKRAYRHICSNDQLANEIIELYMAGKKCGQYTYRLNKDEVLKVLEDLKLPPQKNQISLVTLGPRYLILPAINGDYIIDYAAILPILMTKMHFLSVEEETKGRLFENVVIARLKKKGFDLWECQKKLEHSDSTSKEIDVSFIFKGFLFIGELKSNKKSLNYIKGDTKSLQFRKEKMRTALKQVDDKVKWLSLHPSGKNYCIPKEVKAIVPFVVTPFNEYIWSTDGELWLTESIPRCCTPSECEMLCCDDVINALTSKSYIKFLF